MSSYNDDQLAKMIEINVLKSPDLKLLNIRPEHLIIKFERSTEYVKKIHGGNIIEITFAIPALSNLQHHINDALQQINKRQMRVVMAIVPYVRVNTEKKIWKREPFIASNEQGIFQLISKSKITVTKTVITTMTDSETGISVSYVDSDNMNEAKMQIELSKKVADSKIDRHNKLG